GEHYLVITAQMIGPPSKNRNQLNKTNQTRKTTKYIQLMEAEKSNGEKWINQLTELIEDYRSLITVRMTEHSSMAISLSIIGTLSVIMAVFILLFAGLGTAWWLGEYLNNIKAGF